jgi:hypothetical protein
MANSNTSPNPDLSGVDDTGVGLPVGTDETLSSYAGPYVSDMLGKGAALADTPYEAYTGPLTAGESDLQTTAFEGIAGLTIPTDEMGAFDLGTFDASEAEQYMNPYLMAALQPQIDEARRQSDIERQRVASRLSSAGSYGGGRQAIMDSENQRNLLSELSGITGEGYRDAYDKAMGQFNTEQDRGRSVQEDINRYGLAALEKTKSFGDDQRGIAAEGIAADKLQFEEEQMDPYKKVQFLQSLLDGLPIGSTSTSYSEMSDAQKGGAIYDLVLGLFGPGSTTSENSGGA